MIMELSIYFMVEIGEDMRLEKEKGEVVKVVVSMAVASRSHGRNCE